MLQMSIKHLIIKHLIEANYDMKNSKFLNHTSLIIISKLLLDNSPNQWFKQLNDTFPIPFQVNSVLRRVSCICKKAISMLPNQI